MLNERDEIDSILDSALSSYAAEPASLGLEERVLNRVRFEGRRVRRPWWKLSLAAAAAVACLALLLPIMKKPKPVVSTIAAASKPFVQVEATRPDELQAARSPRKREPGYRPLSKRKQFPTPVPMTKDEQGLVVLAKFPADELAKLAEDLNPEPAIDTGE